MRLRLLLRRWPMAPRLLAILLTLLLLTFAVKIILCGEFNYGLLTSDWGGLCAEGIHQSPVDIVTSRVKFGGRSKAFEFNYSTWTSTVVTGAKHTTSFYPPGLKTDTLLLEDGHYVLNQFHFHSPAEHAINGQYGIMEAHFVHTAMADRSKHAVVSVILNQHPQDMDSPFMESLLPYFARTTGARHMDVSFNPSELFSSNNPLGLSYYCYNGSLTTPPCLENVQWYVLIVPQFVSSRQVRRFVESVTVLSGGIDSDSRPVQPLNNRVVMAYNA